MAFTMAEDLGQQPRILSQDTGESLGEEILLGPASRTWGISKEGEEKRGHEAIIRRR